MRFLTLALLPLAVKANLDSFLMNLLASSDFDVGSTTTTTAGKSNLRMLQESTDTCEVLLNQTYQSAYERDQKACACSINGTVATLDCSNYDYCEECRIENGLEICSTQNNTFLYDISSDDSTLTERSFCIIFEAGTTSSEVCYEETRTGEGVADFTCAFEIGGNTCNSCAPSECGGGRVTVAFDCTNILEGEVADRCDEAPVEVGSNPIGPFAGMTFLSCVSPPTESPTSSSAPTVSMAPSDLPSDQPSQSPTQSQSPTMSKMPSTAPSVSMMPSLSMAPSSVPSDQPSQFPSVSKMPSTGPSISMMPSISMVPTVSKMPSTAPSISMMPSISMIPSVSSFPSSVPSTVEKVSMAPSPLDTTTMEQRDETPQPNTSSSMMPSSADTTTTDAQPDETLQPNVSAASSMSMTPSSMDTTTMEERDETPQPSSNTTPMSMGIRNSSSNSRRASSSRR